MHQGVFEVTASTARSVEAHVCRQTSVLDHIDHHETINVDDPVLVPATGRLAAARESM